MADVPWHVTAEQTSGWPDALHARKGNPGEKDSLGYPTLGFSRLQKRSFLLRICLALF